MRAHQQIYTVMYISHKVIQNLDFIRQYTELYQPTFSLYSHTGNSVDYKYGFTAKSAV